MSKKKKKSNNDEYVDEYCHIYYEELNTVEDQREDIKKLIILLIEHDIPLPDDIINKYLRKSSLNLIDIPEDELPF